MRLLTAVAALAEGEIRLTGTERMCQRPLADLIDALNGLGVSARSVNGDGCPPVVVPGGGIRGGSVSVRCGISSQFLSGLLLVGPCTQEGLEVAVSQGPVSKPYIDMTVAVMERLGIRLERNGYQRFNIPGRQRYRSGDYTVEPDISNAGYFWAAAAVAGGRVTVRGVGAESRQGDIRLAALFEQMGCTVIKEAEGLAVSGSLDSAGRPRLSAIDVDMGDMPDMVPTLAVVAAFADGTTVIRNVAHLRAKESDRLAAVATELGKMGIAVRAGETELYVQGGHPHGAVIDTYDDHRIAMSFAAAGLAVPGVFIRDEGCVRKSFPGFWDVLEGLYTG
jgi:3-phosphoshikimate 1-carboxyvinyltransferase